MSGKNHALVVTTLCMVLLPCTVQAANTGLAYQLFGSEMLSVVKNLGIFLRDYVIPLLYSIGFLVFVWGVFRYFIVGSDNQDERNKAKTLLVYSVIGFLLLTVTWGLLNFVFITLGIDPGVTGASPFPTDSVFPLGVTSP